jgi:hypothetical protein
MMSRHIQFSRIKRSESQLIYNFNTGGKKTTTIQQQCLIQTAFLSQICFLRSITTQQTFLQPLSRSSLMKPKLQCDVISNNCQHENGEW